MVKQPDRQLLESLLTDMKGQVALARLDADGYTNPDIIASYTRTAECRLAEAQALWRLMDGSGLKGIGPIPD